MPLTKIKLVDFLVVSLVARIPSVVTSTYAGDAFAESNIALMIAAYAFILVLFIVGYTCYSKWSLKHNKDTEHIKTE